jgi:hypothetical protein
VRLQAPCRVKAFRLVLLLSAPSLPCFTVSQSTASQRCVVAELSGIPAQYVSVVRRARALVRALRRLRLQHWCEVDRSAALFVLLTVEIERVPSEAPSSLPSLTASTSAASYCCVVASLYGIAEYCFPVLSRCRAIRYRRVLFPNGTSSTSTSAGPSSAPSLTPALVRTGSLSFSPCSSLRLSLTAETERVPSEAPSSLPSENVSTSAAS